MLTAGAKSTIRQFRHTWITRSIILWWWRQRHAADSVTDKLSRKWEDKENEEQLTKKRERPKFNAFPRRWKNRTTLLTETSQLPSTSRKSIAWDPRVARYIRYPDRSKNNRVGTCDKITATYPMKRNDSEWCDQLRATTESSESGVPCRYRTGAVMMIRIDMWAICNRSGGIEGRTQTFV